MVRLMTSRPGPSDTDERRDEPHVSPRQEMARSAGMMLAMMGEATAAARQREGAPEEVRLLTMNNFGPRVRVRIGGLVTARSGERLLFPLSQS